MEALERNMLQPLLQHVLVPLEVPQVRQVQVQVWPGGAEVPQGLGAAGEQIVGDGFRITRQESSRVVL